MSTLTIRRITSFLDKTFKGKIDLSNLHPKVSETDKQKQYRSRAFAAYSLTVAALAEIEDAVNSITDGYEDNGIDAIYYDKGTKNLWIVQSKFSDTGKGGIDNGDIEKFAKGVKKLINADFNSFNQRIKDREDEILTQLENTQRQTSS